MRLYLRTRVLSDVAETVVLRKIIVHVTTEVSAIGGRRNDETC